MGEAPDLREQVDCPSPEACDRSCDQHEKEPKGRPHGGAKSEAGRAAYWRMQYESAIGALADLIAENTENVEAIRAVLAECDNAEDQPDWRDEDGDAWVEVKVIRRALAEVIPPEGPQR